MCENVNYFLHYAIHRLCYRKSENFDYENEYSKFPELMVTP